MTYWRTAAKHIITFNYYKGLKKLQAILHSLFNIICLQRQSHEIFDLSFVIIKNLFSIPDFLELFLFGIHSLVKVTPGSLIK